MKNTQVKNEHPEDRFVFFKGSPEGQEAARSPEQPKKQVERPPVDPETVGTDAKDNGARLVDISKQKSEELAKKTKSWAEKNEKEREQERVLSALSGKLGDAHKHIGQQIKSGNREILKPENMAQTILNFVKDFYDHLSTDEQKILLNSVDLPMIKSWEWTDRDIIAKVLPWSGRSGWSVTIHIWFEEKGITVKAFPPSSEK